jgi:hypothetical protein
MGLIVYLASFSQAPSTTDEFINRNNIIHAVSCILGLTLVPDVGIHS